MPFNRPATIAVPDLRVENRAGRLFAGTGQDFQVSGAADVTQIDLYDEIGVFGISAKDFRGKLKDAGNVVLRINSPGGDVFQGLAIYNDLISHNGSIRVEITGIAASIASIIAMAGDERAMAENAFMMVHRSWGVTIGNASAHDEASALLQQVDRAMAQTYAHRTGMDARDVARLLADETWMTGKQAKDFGFATEILEASDLRARFDLSVYAKVPDRLKDDYIAAPLKAGDVTNKREFEKFLRDAGFPRSRAKAISAGYKTFDDQREADEEVSELAAYIAASALHISNSLSNGT